jgi:MscS family membrane protein
MPDGWLRQWLPAALLARGPRGLLLWQWLALPLILALAWVLGGWLGSLTRAAFDRLAARVQPGQPSVLAVRLARPVRLAWALALATLLVSWLDLPARPEAFTIEVLRTAGIVALFWGLWAAAAGAAEGMRVSAWGQSNPAAHGLLFIGERIAKVTVASMGVIAALSQLGYPVASLLAGLGIGGLALALAAQKTVENLFGSISLAVDQPFRVGDFVRVEDFYGVVENIGLRSTRFRTLDRSLVTIPNGRLAEMRLESLAARDRIRLDCSLGLVYETTAAQLRVVGDGIEAALRAHPKIWQETVVVRFKGLGAFSLDIEVQAWFETGDFNEFRGYREEMLLRFMDVVAGAGTSFAFPTRTVHLAAGSPAAGPQESGAA